MTTPTPDATPLDSLKYPVGRAPRRRGLEPAEVAALIDEIAALPAALRSAIDGLDDAQLDTPYRPGGWTVRQVVHHLPDSHVNAYVRFKLAVTEEEPLVRVYDEAAWAELPEARTGDVAMSLDLLHALHHRWTTFLRAIPHPDWQRTFRHPDHGVLTLELNLQLYAWHCRHHLAHVTGLRERSGW